MKNKKVEDKLSVEANDYTASMKKFFVDNEKTFDELDQQMFDWFRGFLKSGKKEYIFNDICVDLGIEDNSENFWKSFTNLLHVLEDFSPTVFAKAVEKVGYVHYSRIEKLKTI
jgi:hypothetical protein